MLYTKLKEILLDKKQSLFSNRKTEIAIYSPNHKTDKQKENTNPLAILSHKYAKFYAEINQGRYISQNKLFQYFH